jgi:aspartokinase-like uncharacterized kinase
MTATITIDLVVKVGGSLLSTPQHLQWLLEAIGAAASTRPLLVVPGGGPFADTVRQVDEQLGLADDAAHWMAVLAIDQYAHLLASRISAGRVVVGTRGISTALEARRVPVLAPTQWLRESDPLPHSWDVTSDSIAAWVAGQVRARQLVLVKPPVGFGDALLDPYFNRALSSAIDTFVVRADEHDELSALLRGGSVAGGVSEKK